MLLLGALVVLSACEPVKKDVKMGGVLNANDLSIRVDNVTPGSNSVIMRNLTPGVTGQWKQGEDILGVGDEVPVILASLGEVTLTFVAFCDGGTVSKDTSVTINQLDVIPDSWLLFAGTTPEGKTWVWDSESNGGGVYGAGGYGHSKVPNWGNNAVGTTTGGGIFVDPEAKMVFDTNGGANFTMTDSTGSKKGSFSFSEKKAIANFSIGQLTIGGGAMIPAGYEYYSGGAIPQVFDILRTDDNHLVFNYAAPGAVIFDPAWATTSTMWVFKAVEE